MRNLNGTASFWEKEETELLKKAVVNLIIDNASLRTSLEEAVSSKDSYWKWYQEEKAETEKLMEELKELKKAENI